MNYFVNISLTHIFKMSRLLLNSPWIDKKRYDVAVRDATEWSTVYCTSWSYACSTWLYM